MKLTSDQISDIPYVLFINDKGQGWTLNRQYKLQYHNIGGWKGLRRDVIEKLIPLAIRSESAEKGYSLTDPEAIPSWARRSYRIKSKNVTPLLLKKIWSELFFPKLLITIDFLSCS